MSKLFWDRNIDDYTNSESEQVFTYVKDYLKHSGEDLEIEGFTIRYLDYHITSVIDGLNYGFQDELVYVGKRYDIKNNYLGEHFIGMGERNLTAKQKNSFLKTIDKNKLKKIIFGALANKALMEINKKSR